MVICCCIKYECRGPAKNGRTCNTTIEMTKQPKLVNHIKSDLVTTLEVGMDLCVVGEDLYVRGMGDLQMNQ